LFERRERQLKGGKKKAEGRGKEKREMGEKIERRRETGWSDGEGKRERTGRGSEEEK